MSVISSVHEWKKEPDQLDHLPDEEKKNFLHTLISGIKDGTIIIDGKRNVMLIKSPFGGTITCMIGDIVFIVRTKNYPSYIMACAPYFFEEIKSMYKEEGDEDISYSIGFA